MIRTGDEYRESVRDGRDAASINVRVLQENQVGFPGAATASIVKKGV